MRFLWKPHQSHPSMKNNASTFGAPKGIRMHYMTRRYHSMQKHKFGIRCLDAFLWNPYRSHPSKKNSASTFRVSDAP
jgi:hypothetical protein